MDEAKAAVQDFTAKAGKHDTTVHEVHKPAITHTHITPTEHVSNTTVIDKEVHQHHHHTSVQPIHHREVLPEKHHHKIIPVEHKEHYHGDHNSVKERLAAEAAQFKDVTETGKTEHTHEVKPVIHGTHIHHHVYETIQPIIQKETIQPTIIHTTIPIHEVHHNEPKHHAATALPAMTMEEFKKRGGLLEGRPEKTDRFEGEPDSESAEQHSKHGGPLLHGFTGRAAAGATTGAALGSTRTGGVAGDSRSTGTTGTRSVTSETTSHATNGAAKGGLRGSGEHDRALEPGTATAAAGAAGVAAAETRHRDVANNKIDPRVDSRVNPPARESSLEAERVGTARTTDVAHQSGKLHKEPRSQFADTHAGSKMDTVSDRNAVTVSTGDGDKVLNTNQHHSNFEAANVTNRSTPAANGSPESTKKRSSLLGRLRPNKDKDRD